MKREKNGVARRMRRNLDDRKTESPGKMGGEYKLNGRKEILVR